MIIKNINFALWSVSIAHFLRSCGNLKFYEYSLRGVGDLALVLLYNTQYLADPVQLCPTECILSL